MRTSRIPALALGAALSAAGPAAAQPAAPVPTPGPPGRVLSVTLATPAPATFRGVCSPARAVELRGTIATDTAQPTQKGLDRPGQFIWSDWKTDRVDVLSRSADGKVSQIRGVRFFDKSFDGWVKLQAQPWPDTRPRESAQVAVKITCEPPVFKQLQHAPAGSSSVPPPAPGPGR